MKIPVIRGVIDRRILLNYRVAPEVLASIVPPPFRPKLHRGYGMVGICLIRLRGIGPVFLPRGCGFSSENAAHRVAVEWDEDRVTREGVYVARRDTSSRINALAGGRLFPGIHHHASFETRETATHFEVGLQSDDGVTRIAVVGDLAPDLPGTSIFKSLAEASAFFEGGSLGYSATADAGRFHGLELRCDTWEVAPLAVSEVHSSFFDDRVRFPEGSIAFDCALIMRGVSHAWHGRADLCCATSAVSRGISRPVSSASPA